VLEPPSWPPEPDPSEPEDVVVVVVVELEPPSAPEPGPEEPPGEESWLEPSRPELVGVPLPPSVTVVVGWAIAVVSSEPWRLPSPFPPF